MKCVKKEGQRPIRVSDEKAVELVASGGYSYCCKKEWKESK